MLIYKNLIRMVSYVFVLFLAACATPRPDNVNDVCDIFKQYPSWYWATKDVATHWRVPIQVQMAIMYQESRFSAVARPPRTKLLWIIPWKRASTSYGYTQALESTWARYQRDTGKHWASRDSFTDATDFIGWYGYGAYKKAGINRSDAYRLYLAYHEGVGGYNRGTYRSKPWLIGVAKKVARQSSRYQRQLKQCEGQLQRKAWYRFW